MLVSRLNGLPSPVAWWPEVVCFDRLSLRIKGGGDLSPTVHGYVVSMVTLGGFLFLPATLMGNKAEVCVVRRRRSGQPGR